MPKRQSKRTHARDAERNYSPEHFVRKLRRLATSVSAEKPFRIRIAGERVTIPSNAIISIEHERDRKTEKIEFQFKWNQRRSSQHRSLMPQALTVLPHRLAELLRV